MAKKIIKGKNYYKQLKQLLNNCVTNLTGIGVAAILVTDKGPFPGVNFEHSICSISMCAERVALYGALPYGINKIYEVHILSRLNGMSMCGACRQAVSAYADKDCRVYSYIYATGGRTECTLGKLLPEAPLTVKNKVHIK